MILLSAVLMVLVFKPTIAHAATDIMEASATSLAASVLHQQTLLYVMVLVLARNQIRVYVVPSGKETNVKLQIALVFLATLQAYAQAMAHARNQMFAFALQDFMEQFVKPHHATVF